MLIPNEKIPIVRSWSDGLIVRTKEVHCFSIKRLDKNALCWTHRITVFYGSHISSTCVTPSRSNDRYVRFINTRSIIRGAWPRFLEDHELVYITITSAKRCWSFLSHSMYQTHSTKSRTKHTVDGTVDGSDDEASSLISGSSCVENM